MKQNKGLTLIELLVALGILAIVICFGVPFGRASFQKVSLQSVEAELVTAIHYARNMAFFYGKSLALAPLSKTNNWSNGMILFVDNKKHEFSTTDKIIYQWQWHFKGIKISWIGFQSQQYLIFANELKHAACSGHFTIKNKDKIIRITVNRFGRTSRGLRD